MPSNTSGSNILVPIQLNYPNQMNNGSMQSGHHNSQHHMLNQNMMQSNFQNKMNPFIPNRFPPPGQQQSQHHHMHQIQSQQNLMQQQQRKINMFPDQPNQLNDQQQSIPIVGSANL